MTPHEFFEQYQPFLPLAIVPQFEEDLREMMQQEHVEARETAGQD